MVKFKKIPEKIYKDRIDNYYYLKDNQDLILSDLKQIDKESYNKVNKKIQNELYNEFKSRTNENYISYPYYDNKYNYYTKISQNNNYIQLFRYELSINNTELILDCNKLAIGETYFDLGCYDVSKCNRYLLYTIDTDGSEFYKLYLKDIKLEKTILINSNICSEILWIDNNQYMYIKYNPSNRPYQVWKCNLTNNKNMLLYEELDDKFIVSIYKSNDNKYLFINVSSKVCNEIYYLNNNNLILIQKRINKVFYNIEHNNNKFYILTNINNYNNNELMYCNLENTNNNNWNLLIKYENIDFNEMIVFENYIALNGKKNGLSIIYIYNILSQKFNIIEYDCICYLSFYQNYFYSDKLIYILSSTIQPNKYYEYNMNTDKELLKKEDILPTYNSNDYNIIRVKVREDIDLYVTICYKKNLFNKDGKNKCLLYGYGSYGITIEYEFNKYIISLLDRGFIYCIAHIRGGGYLGKHWYNAGKLENKMNTFYDFIDISKYLIKHKFIDKTKLSIQGGSAGGLLIGAVINMEPTLFKNAIANVPFLDVLTTMCDSSLPLTVGEYDEWGNPNDNRFYDYIKSYSPIDNITKQYYPNILLTTSLNDTHVGFWEPVKYWAKMKEYNLNNNILLKINFESGHQSTSKRYEYLLEMAFQYGFILINSKK